MYKLETTGTHQISGPVHVRSLWHSSVPRPEKQATGRASGHSHYTNTTQLTRAVGKPASLWVYRTTQYINHYIITCLNTALPWGVQLYAESLVQVSTDEGEVCGMQGEECGSSAYSGLGELVGYAFQDCLLQDGTLSREGVTSSGRSAPTR